MDACSEHILLDVWETAQRDPMLRLLAFLGFIGVVSSLQDFIS